MRPDLTSKTLATIKRYEVSVFAKRVPIIRWFSNPDDPDSGWLLAYFSDDSINRDSLSSVSVDTNTQVLDRYTGQPISNRIICGKGYPTQEDDQQLLYQSSTGLSKPVDRGVSDQRNCSVDYVRLKKKPGDTVTLTLTNDKGDEKTAHYTIPTPIKENHGTVYTLPDPYLDKRRSHLNPFVLYDPGWYDDRNDPSHGGWFKGLFISIHGIKDVRVDSSTTVYPDAWGAPIKSDVICGSNFQGSEKDQELIYNHTTRRPEVHGRVKSDNETKDESLLCFVEYSRLNKRGGDIITFIVTDKNNVTHRIPYTLPQGKSTTVDTRPAPWARGEGIPHTDVGVSNQAWYDDSEHSDQGGWYRGLFFAVEGIDRITVDDNTTVHPDAWGAPIKSNVICGNDFQGSGRNEQLVFNNTTFLPEIKLRRPSPLCIIDYIRLDKRQGDAVTFTIHTSDGKKNDLPVHLVASDTLTVGNASYTERIDPYTGQKRQLPTHHHLSGWAIFGIVVAVIVVVAILVVATVASGGTDAAGFVPLATEAEELGTLTAEGAATAGGTTAEGGLDAADAADQAASRVQRGISQVRKFGQQATRGIRRFGRWITQGAQKIKPE